MVLAKRRLPGGRGLYRTEEAFIDQGESFEGRKAILPLENGAVISTAPWYSFTGVSTFTANRVMLFALPLILYDTIVDEARIRVTTLSAAQNARIAIFAFNPRDREFKKIAGTEVLFSTAATGLLESDLARRIRLVASKFYFVAFKASDAVAEFTSTASGTGVFNQLYFGSASGAISASVTLAALTRTTVGPVPAVVYYSHMMKDVI